MFYYQGETIIIIRRTAAGIFHPAWSGTGFRRFYGVAGRVSGFNIFMLFHDPARSGRCQRSSSSSDPSALAGVRSARSNASCRLLAEACSCPSVFVPGSDEPDVWSASPANEPRRQDGARAGGGLVLLVLLAEFQSRTRPSGGEVSRGKPVKHPCCQTR